MSRELHFPDSLTDTEAVAQMAAVLHRDPVIGWVQDFNWHPDGTTLTAVCWDHDLYKLGRRLVTAWGSFDRALGDPALHFRSPGESGRLVEVQWKKVRHPYRGQAVAS